MSQFTAKIADAVLAACRANSADIAGALTRALGPSFSFAPPETTSLFRRSEPPAEWNGPGLAVLLTFGDVGFVALVPESSGMMPAWYAAPDPTGASKLASLAQELGMLFVPEEYITDDFRAGRVGNLAEAVARGVPDEETALIPVALSVGEESSTLYLLWPFAKPAGVFAEPVTAPPPAPPAAPKLAEIDDDDPFLRLPPYIRSMLQLDVPVQVTLASKKESIRTIVALAPGSIIGFDKPCDHLLDLEVNGHRVAQGEVVKVGDKFGLRIDSMVLPEERFVRLNQLLR